jgi:hypothetical protein
MTTLMEVPQVISDTMEELANSVEFNGIGRLVEEIANLRLLLRRVEALPHSPQDWLDEVRNAIGVEL